MNVYDFLAFFPILLVLWTSAIVVALFVLGRLFPKLERRDREGGPSVKPWRVERQGLGLPVAPQATGTATSGPR